MRPNIRIEIQNDAPAAMEVDENEEGEVEDSDEGETSAEPNTQLSANKFQLPPVTKGAFVAGFDVLDKKEQEKLQERAKRFQLKPDEIKNFTDEDLQNLHTSLGITPRNDSVMRFDAIHMRGTEEMTTEDVLEYFLKYAPVSIEWIDDNSCNVIWLDQTTAARALHFISKPVRGMPVRDDRDYFNITQELDSDLDQSPLLVNKNREVQLQEDSSVVKVDFANSVDISEISAPIPPGYWRLGNKAPKSSCLLVRFSMKTDQNPFKTEQFSWYTNKKLRKTAKGRPQGIFGRNKDMTTETQENPWSILAKNWDEDEKFRERERGPAEEEPKVEVSNPNLRVRLGSKRKETHDSDSEKAEPKKVKIPRMRMYADEEEEKIKRKKLLHSIKQQFDKIAADESPSDLRKVLSTNSRRTVKPEEPKVVDLGSILKNRTKKLVFEVKTEHAREHEERPARHPRERREVRQRLRTYHDEDNDGVSYDDGKPKSKVAVVIKTQKKPAVASTVASTVWSRISRVNNSESSSENGSEDSSSSRNSSESGQEEEEEETIVPRRTLDRPGFNAHARREAEKKSVLHKNPLKIEISNDHYKNN